MMAGKQLYLVGTQLATFLATGKCPTRKMQACALGLFWGAFWCQIAPGKIIWLKNGKKMLTKSQNLDEIVKLTSTSQKWSQLFQYFCSTAKVLLERLNNIVPNSYSCSIAFKQYYPCTHIVLHLAIRLSI